MDLLEEVAKAKQAFAKMPRESREIRVLPNLASSRAVVHRGPDTAKPVFSAARAPLSPLPPDLRSAYWLPEIRAQSISFHSLNISPIHQAALAAERVAPWLL